MTAPSNHKRILGTWGNRLFIAALGLVLLLMTAVVLDQHNKNNSRLHPPRPSFRSIDLQTISDGISSGHLSDHKARHFRILTIPQQETTP